MSKIVAHAKRYGNALRQTFAKEGKALKPKFLIYPLAVGRQMTGFLRAGLENLSIEQLTFKTGEETLCHRIVVGVANAAQGLA